MYNKYLIETGLKTSSYEFLLSCQIDQLMDNFDRLVYVGEHGDLLDRKNVIDFFSRKISVQLEPKYGEYDFYDLFCGAGGLSLGFENNGFRVSSAVEKDLSAVKTYHFNRPYLKHSQIIQDDITKHQDDIELKYAPLIVGGPPCQGFSNANKQRKASDNRNDLYKFFVKKVNGVKPEIFLMENVCGILRYIDDIKRDFNDIGYSLDTLTLNTSDFGLPQNRKRVFIIGFKTKFSVSNIDIVELFKRYVAEQMPSTKYNLIDAIGNLPKLNAKTKRNATWLECNSWGGTFSKKMTLSDEYSRLINGEISTLPILNHKTKFNNHRDIEIYSLMEPGDRSDSQRISHLNPYTSRSEIFKDKFYKLEPERPCKTITSHMYYDCHMYIHPYQSRGLTPREAARIQGFPDDYLFLGTPNEWYRQIGNAVSPMLANILGAATKRVLDKLFSV